jgi:hypothetical protein
MTKVIYYGDETGRHEAKGDMLEQILKDQSEYEAEQKRIEQEQTAKAIAKTELLNRLGITAEEAALLLS